MYEDIINGLVFYDNIGKHRAEHDLQQSLPELISLCSEADQCALAKLFVNLVWKIEKQCHSIVDIPIESVFRPNYDVYRYLGLSLAKFLFDGDDKKIIIFIEYAIKSGIMWPRFGHLMLATLYLNHNKPIDAYEHAQKAHAAFGQDGAANRILYECWDACRKAGISTQENFPLPENIQQGFCSQPFEYLVIRNDGKSILLAPCCTSFWLPYGKTYQYNTLDAEIKNFWNSYEFQEIRRSILDGEFTYCSKVRCPFFTKIIDRKMVKNGRLRHIIDNHSTYIEDGPKIIVCTYDETCNLSCPSCRSHKIAATSEQRKNYDTMADKFILPIITPQTDHILVNGSGEAFASAHTMRLIRSLPFDNCPNLKVHLMSNGELLADRWHSLGQATNHIEKLILSFDGISKETYEKYRRGGHLDRFLKSITFASQLRKNGTISSLVAVMTIFSGNMHEAISIYEFCNDHNFDSFVINKFQNWGTFSAEEFMQMDVWNSNHIQHKEWNFIFNKLKELSKKKKTMFNTTNIM